jgi:hypothetical protein
MRFLILKLSVRKAESNNGVADEDGRCCKDLVVVYNRQRLDTIWAKSRNEVDSAQYVGRYMVRVLHNASCRQAQIDM